MDKNLTIAAYIKEFISSKSTAHEPRFFLNELHAFVQSNSGRLPTAGSVDRILRKLRVQGEINYMVLNRATSYYMAMPVAVAPQQ